ncbi:MAG: hypothetical protein J6M63_01935, partial [Pseudobutyrivibrio sp.]|nr:hypothetical protein [Pseudobutyrivibrio sp.]
MAEINQMDESDESVETETLEVVESLDDETLPDIPKTTEEAVEETDESEAADVAENGERTEVGETSVSDNILVEEASVEKVDGEELSEDTDLKVAFDQEAEVDGVCISVKADEGVFPEGATLSVAKVYGSDLQAVEAAVEEERADDKNKVESYTFDIKVLDVDGNEIEPDNSQGQVRVSFTLAEVANANLETDVYHVKGEVGDLSVDKLEATETSTTVEAVTDGFSFYTVEFTYNNLQYVMNGDTTVALAEILNHVGLQGTVTNAVSDAPELFSVANTDSGWSVTAHEAFTTEQRLTVTIDGSDYVIVVTDDVVTPVQYLEWDATVNKLIEKTRTSDYTSISGATTQLGEDNQETWWVVNEDITIDDTITCFGTVHLILCDGKTLTVNNISVGQEGGCNLIIHGQSGQTGRLNASYKNTNPENYNSSTAILADKGITINGSIVNAEGARFGIATQENGSIIINGGIVTAVASAPQYGSKGIFAANANITINAGTVTTTATGDYSHGMYGSIIINNGTVNSTAIGNYTTSVYGDVTIKNGFLEAKSKEGNDGYGISGTPVGSMTILGGRVIASGNSKAINYPLKNNIPGIGWADIEGTTGEESIPISESPQTLQGFKKIQFPANADEEPTDEEPTDEESSIGNADSIIVIPDGVETSVSGDKPTINGLDTKASELAKENGKDVTLNLVVTPKGQSKATQSEVLKQNEDIHTNVKNQFKDEESVLVDFLDISIEQFINGAPAANLSELGVVVEIGISYNFEGKYDPTIVRKHNGSSSIFNEYSSRPSSGYQDASFFIDRANSMLYIYSDKFSDYVIAYSTEEGNAQNRTSVATGGSETASTISYPKTVPVYRLFNANSGQHFYTANKEEHDILVTKGWNDEGIAWQVRAAASIPVYRLFDKSKTGSHLFTS